MKFTRIIVLLLSFFMCQSTFSQEKKRFKVHTIGFYNLENLFDTINDPLKFDERSPIMEMKVDIKEVYQKKVSSMARVVADIGADVAKNAPAILGVSEIENRQVLVDLVNHPLLLAKDYGIIHYDSPDARGIDVALIYQKSLFRPISHSKHLVKIFDDQTRKRIHTRDQLLVSGLLDGDLIHVIVNHWSSRSGGEARSRSKRIGAGKVNKRIIDSIQAEDPYAKIFTMGDFNDNPTNESIKKVLNTESNKDKVKLKGIYNPYENMFKKDGLGTTAWRDAWSLFDQILVTKPLVEKDYSSYRLYKAKIYNKTYLTNKRGRWKGYPKRSFSDGSFTGGFSDHFPVYVHVIKEDTE